MAHAGGRPPKYKKVEEIEEKIESLEQVIQTIIDYLIGKISEEVMISQL